jgi:rhodanese-related sulfurtransferase
MKCNFFFILLLITACFSTPKTKTKMNQLKSKEWSEYLGKTPKSLILDVRTADEYKSGYIKNAVNVDIYGGSDFIESIKKLNKNYSYFVYCRSGARSAQACQLMQQMGFEKVFNLDGGILAWEGKIEN